jgi:glycosyltransferase involved in cell wall biosynthesis
LQKTILRGIEQAANITTISNATRGDMLRISYVSDDRVHSIPLGLDSSFKSVPAVEAKQIISRFISPDAPFILHVGGNQWYKNRLGVFRVFRRIVDAEKAPLNLVLAGKPLDAGLTAELERLRLNDRVFFAHGCDDRELRALYSSARLLLFPSLYEGFGWPILEAQACGCRVVTTGQEPMTDVGGSAAAYIDPADLDGSARVVRELLNESPVRTENRIQAGFENVRRFEISEMISRYMALYSEIGAGLIPVCEGKGKARLAA